MLNPVLLTNLIVAIKNVECIIKNVSGKEENEKEEGLVIFVITVAHKFFCHPEFISGSL